MYDKSVGKVNNIYTSRFVLKTKYCTDKSDLEKIIPDNSGLVNNLVKKTDYNAKITEIEGKIPRISRLATNVGLTAVENKIPDINNLVKKKKEYDANITKIESKYVTTTDYNKCTKNIVDNNIKSKNLVDKFDIAEFINNTDLDQKLATLIATLETKAELKAEQDKIIKLQAFDSSYLREKSKSHFAENSTQKYLVFQPMYRYFKRTDNTDYILSWKSKGLSDEFIKSSSALQLDSNPQPLSS